MLVVLVMPYLPRLKTILQSKILYIILFVFIFFYVLINCVVIKYQTKINDFTYLEGKIIDIDIKEDSLSFILKTNIKEKVKCQYYFQEYKDEYNTLLGKTVRVEGTVKKINNNTIPNTFNYQKYLYNNSIYISYVVQNYTIINQENIFYKIKNQISQKINNSDEKLKPYLNLFILGDKGYLDNNLYNTYRTNGIWHLFAVSGMHISLIILILDKLLKKIKFKKIIIIVILFYFMFLTSFSASVMRATIFYFLKTIFDYLNIAIDNKKILLLTAFIILLLNPFMLFNNGFQYSFLITMSIMFLSNHITGNYFSQILKVSLIAFIVSLPITINLNYEINLLSIILNIFYVPLISIIIFPLSILVFIMPFLSFILKIFIVILEVSNNFFGSLKLSIIMPKMPIYLIIIYYLSCYLFYKIKKKYIYLIIIILFINYICPKLDNSYYVYFLDVGQGDSTLFISPYKKEIMLIDTGGSYGSDYHVSDNVILFLKSLGISKIDLLIISHGDADHGREALNYLEKYTVKNIILNKNKLNNLENTIKKKGHIVNNYTIKYFNYHNINDYLSDDENYSSIITNIKIKNYQFLLMGDAPQEIENKLIHDYYLKADFLKVGHHGSKTSSSKIFIDEVNPKYAIISVGQNNRYNHPNNETLINLIGRKVYRTDQDGSIMVKITNNNLKIVTYKP